MTNEYLFLDYCINRYILSSDEIKLLGIKNNVFIKYNEKKYLYHLFLSCHNYQIISLGSYCLSHTLPIRWGLKHTRREMNVNTRLPFDLAVTPIKSVAEILNNDFQNYYADNFRKRDDHRYEFINTELGIIFNHDLFNEYTENLLSFFNSQLMDRVQEFKKTYTDDNTLYILCTENLSNLDIPIIMKIHNIISEKTLGKLIVINLCNNDCNVINPTPNFLINAIKPHDQYIWFMPTDYFTDQGFLFEHRIIDFIYSNLLQISLPRENKKELSQNRGAKFYNLASTLLLKQNKNRDLIYFLK